MYVSYENFEEIDVDEFQKGRYLREKMRVNIVKEW